MTLPPNLGKVWGLRVSMVSFENVLCGFLLTHRSYQSAIYLIYMVKTILILRAMALESVTIISLRLR